MLIPHSHYNCRTEITEKTIGIFVNMDQQQVLLKQVIFDKTCIKKIKHDWFIQNSEP